MKATQEEEEDFEAIVAKHTSNLEPAAARSIILDSGLCVDMYNIKMTV